MKNLQLSLINQWFEMTKEKIKLEDYREITPYWCSRFLLWNGFKVSQQHWLRRLSDWKDMTESNGILEYIKLGLITFQEFDNNIMTLGYPKSDNSERILKLEHKGIEIREGNPEWGAVSGRKYFVVMHGFFLK